MSDGCARISAVMEAVENAMAEDWEHLVTEIASSRELEDRRSQPVPLGEIMRCSTGRFDREQERAWVPGVSLCSGKTYFAPFELIGLDLRHDAPWDRVAFRMSSIGLAAGKTLVEATLHALLEVLENHATAPLGFFGLEAGLARPVAHRPGYHKELDCAVGRVRDAGVDPTFVEITSGTRLPVIGCFITRELQDSDRSGLGIHGGFACRTEPADAALAALLEAVQSRATDIAGARDDIAAQDYLPSHESLRMCKASQSYIDDLPARYAVCLEGSTIGQLRHVLDCVLQSGPGDVFIFPLGGEDCGIRAVRVLATRLEAST